MVTKTAAKKKKLPRVTKRSKKQTGLSNIKLDKGLPAMAPGRRLSKAGKPYTERRRNRSDRPPGSV